MGVPELRCNCEVCLSDDVKDKRLRASVLLETKEHQILIDCGPDFRQQMLNNPSLYPETLLLTHSHYDHIAGIDDLRPFSRERAIDIYADQSCAETLRQNFSYMFKEHKYPGPNLVSTWLCGYIRGLEM